MRERTASTDCRPSYPGLCLGAANVSWGVFRSVGVLFRGVSRGVGVSVIGSKRATSRNRADLGDIYEVMMNGRMPKMRDIIQVGGANVVG